MVMVVKKSGIWQNDSRRDAEAQRRVAVTNFTEKHASESEMNFSHSRSFVSFMAKACVSVFLLCVSASLREKAFSKTAEKLDPIRHRSTIQS
jgi:hypothetical protein